MSRLKRIITVVLFITSSLAIATFVCNKNGIVWEERVRLFLYTAVNDTITDYAIESVDNKGIPRVYYRQQNGITAGSQYNATIVSNYAIRYYNTFIENGDNADRKKFLNCLDWLAGNMEINGNYALFEFNWQQPWYPSVGVPFTSGMASGRAIEAFIYGYKLESDPRFLHYCRLLLNGFFIPIENGGFTYKEANGWWYEEVADERLKTPRILDGHIFAITGIHKYWQFTNDDSANTIIEKGVRALKNQLPFYDAGDGGIFYDVHGKVADKKYHRILTMQMKELWEMTSDKVFLEYYNRWNTRLQQPYVLTIFKEKNRSGIVLFLLVSVATFLSLAGLLFFISRVVSPKHSTIN